MKLSDTWWVIKAKPDFSGVDITHNPNYFKSPQLDYEWGFHVDAFVRDQTSIWHCDLNLVDIRKEMFRYMGWAEAGDSLKKMDWIDRESFTDKVANDLGFLKQLNGIFQDPENKAWVVLCARHKDKIDDKQFSRIIRWYGKDAKSVQQSVAMKLDFLTTVAVEPKPIREYIYNQWYNAMWNKTH